MELFALFGMFVLFGAMYKLAKYANGYYSDNRLMRTRQFAYLKSELNKDMSEEAKRKIENARWNILLDK